MKSGFRPLQTEDVDEEENEENYDVEDGPQYSTEKKCYFS